MIRICVRQTLDWSDEAFVRENIFPRFRQKFDMWNATFTMPYHVFRRHLTDIAVDNVAAVRGACVSTLSEMDEGDIIVPVDDDDWFAPDLAERLSAAFDGTRTAALWTRLPLEPTTALRDVRRWLGNLLGVGVTGRRYVCKTNNYALRWTASVAGAALNHVTASAWVEAHPAGVMRMPDTLAIQNRSLASQTTLAWKRPSISRADIVSLLENHRHLYARWTPPEGLEWAVPYVARMDALMRDIAVRS